MYLYISNGGVEEHVNHVRKELRFIDLLRDNIRLICKQSDVTPETLTLLLKCDAEIEALENSFRWKINFLQTFNEDMQRMNGRIDWIIDDMNTMLDRSIV